MLHPFRWQRTRWFWRTRHFLSRLAFVAGKFLFVQRQRAKHAREGVSIVGQISRSIAPYLILSVLMVVALEVGENTLADIAVERPVLAKQALEWLVSARGSISRSVDSLTVLFSITASVTGVFLGLYFTAISVVAGSVFARIPGNLRELLLYEKVGNQYIRILGVLRFSIPFSVTFSSCGCCSFRGEIWAKS